MDAPPVGSPDQTITPDEMVVNVLHFALVQGLRVHGRLEQLPGWVFGPGAHGYPVAIRA